MTIIIQRFTASEKSPSVCILPKDLSKAQTGFKPTASVQTDKMNNKPKALKAFQEIPGVGKVVAMDLWNLGYKSIDELSGQDPDEIYVRHNDYRGEVQDICMLYTFRCAVYFAETYRKEQDPEKLKWWNWMDDVKMSSIEKDQQIRLKKSSTKN